MADTAVTERRIRPIQDALSAGNFRQALKDCEKWQKKGESSERFLTLRAAVLLRQPDQRQQEKGERETLQLCRRNPPVLNSEAIHQLQDSLQLLNLDETEGPKLWERAVAARPNDEDLVTTWLNNSISTSNWQNAQKATMALRKAFPKERKYDYWNILMCFLIHQDKNLPEKDRKLFGTLANRMIAKAAQPGQPEKMISTPEELSLLASVFTETGNTSELVQLLQSNDLRSVVDIDPLFAQDLLFRAVNAAQDQSSSERLFGHLLRPSGVDDDIPHDDRPWSLLVNSATSPETVQERSKLVDAIRARHTKHRQAHLAKIDLLIRSHEKKTDQIVKVCHLYYELFESKAFCFDDLIERLRNAGAVVVHEFSNALKDNAPIISSSSQQLFALKLEYYLLFERNHEASKILHFTSKALQLYSSAQDDGAIAPESALLAALALLRLASKSSIAAGVTQASMILKTACSKFKDYYPLRVLLVQVQMVSGQIHLAMENFFQLSVKNLQWETVGHFILTRISSLHPQQHGRGEDSLSPLRAMDIALNVFGNSQRSLDRAIREGLKYGSYSNVIDTVELRSNLQSSIVRQLYTIEQRRCQRILNLPIEPKFNSQEGELTDLRDPLFMPRYGTTDAALSSLLQCGPLPRRSWIDAMNVHEWLSTYLMAETIAIDPNFTKSALENLEKSVSKACAEAEDLTVDEKHAVAIYHDLAAVVLQVSKDGPENARNLDSTLARIQDLSREVKPALIGGVEYPDWRFLHHHYVHLEVLQTTAKFAAILLKKLNAEKDKSKSAVTATLKSSLRDVRPLIVEQVKAVQESARVTKAQLNAPGVLGKLVDAVLAKTDEASASEDHAAFAEWMSKIQDEASVEEYCGSLRESWEDALDGILAVKVKNI